MQCYVVTLEKSLLRMAAISRSIAWFTCSGVTVHLKENVHVGHGAIIHGAEIGQNCLIGMNSVIMDHVIIGAECIVGAMTFIKEGDLQYKQLIAGNPAR